MTSNLFLIAKARRQPYNYYRKILLYYAVVFHKGVRDEPIRAKQSPEENP
jgi:hypothetical protein